MHVTYKIIVLLESFVTCTSFFVRLTETLCCRTMTRTCIANINTKTFHSISHESSPMQRCIQLWIQMGYNAADCMKLGWKCGKTTTDLINAEALTVLSLACQSGFKPGAGLTSGYNCFCCLK